MTLINDKLRLFKRFPSRMATKMVVAWLVVVKGRKVLAA